jgi:hypothetical protein
MSASELGIVVKGYFSEKMAAVLSAGFTVVGTINS